MNDARALGSWTQEGSENERSDLLGLLPASVAKRDDKDVRWREPMLENFRLTAFAPRAHAAMSRDFVVIESFNAFPSL